MIQSHRDAVERAAALLGRRAKRDERLGARTTYRVGGTAALFLMVEDEEDLRAAAEAVRGSGVEVLVVGRGSNLLVADAGFDGLALTLGAGFETVEIDGTRVRAGGPVSLPVVARRTVAAGLTGFEWAVGVPGSMGGAVRMNAGGHGSDMAASLVGVRVLDLATGHDGYMPSSSLVLGYRTSALAATSLVVAADLALEVGDRDAGERTIEEIVRWRRVHQPGGQNAGSVFANPEGRSAGQLVDAAGCRGLRLGSAMVSDKHANFIQSDPSGSADDVARLLAEVQRRVLDSAGITLEPEVRLVGFEPRPPVDVEPHGSGRP